ncbi:MAG: hypothetical protein IT556_07090, partial [Acetobacteraceae bacterium]|nr:hypothetical protein [Acetobacteraceae bacterium]
MRVFPSLSIAGVVLGAGLAATPASAAVASWTDWLSGSPTSATGSLLVGSTTVGVTYSGPTLFVQTGAGSDTNYWVPSAPYISGTVSNAPPGTDIVA